jgi:signal transduction histidine kinase
MIRSSAGKARAATMECVVAERRQIDVGPATGRAVAKRVTSRRRRELARDYTAGLQRYLSCGEDPALDQAHELGRKALIDGLGVLEIVTIHLHAMLPALNRQMAEAEKARLYESLEKFLVEALAPFEMAHRGYWDANAILHRLNGVLEGQAKRIAFALHNDAAQLLAAVHLAIADVASRLPSDAAQRLQTARGLLDQVEHRLRNLAHELRPPILDDLGLVPALEFLGDAVAKRWGFQVTVEARVDRRMPPIVEATLYRITQEALNNIAKHAKASAANVSVRQRAHQIVCSIKDDGIGLDGRVLARGQPPSGLGLLEIRERTAALGGRLHLGCNDTGGTCLTVEIPLERV